MQQRPMLGYVADFYCPACRLVVEVDGKHHLEPEQARLDATRDAAMARAGIGVMRIQARDIFGDGRKLAIKSILDRCYECQIRPKRALRRGE